MVGRYLLEWILQVSYGLSVIETRLQDNESTASIQNKRSKLVREKGRAIKTNSGMFAML